MGLMLAEPGYHTRAFVEWEDWPRAVLIAAQSAGYFAPAPIWDDLRTFDVSPFHGAFDIVLAGFMRSA
jgi:site-specific DNA-cytosine methylase